MLNVTSEERGKVTIINVTGDLNINNAGILEKEFQEKIKKKPETIGINCKNLKSIDSSGLGLFIKLTNSSKSAGSEVVYYDLTGNVVSLFDLSKIDRYFTIMTKSDFEGQYLA